MTDRPDPLDQSIPLEERSPPASMTMEQWELAFENVKLDTVEQLAAAIAALVKGPEGGHDYNMSGISMSIAAQLAFNFVAREVGASGFQASYAALHAYGKVMSIKGPFGIIRADEYLYPQYDPEATLAEWREKWSPWLKEQAEERLADEPGHAADRVVEHWRKLAAWEPEEESSDPT